MSRLSTDRFRWFILILYFLVIVVLAVFPFSATGITAVNKITVVHFRLDHIFHVLAFLPAYPLLIWALQPKRFIAFAVLFLGAMIAAFAAEYVQYYIDYRAYNPADLYSNLGGVIAGTLFTGLFFLVKKL